MAHYRQKHIRPKIKNLSKKKIIKRPIFWFFVVMMILGGISSYIVLFPPFFQVTQIKVISDTHINNQQIEKITLDTSKNTFGKGMMSISSRSIFLANLEKITKEIQKNFPIVKKVDIKKNMPHMINLNIEARKPVAVVCNEQCFFIDINGVIFNHAENSLNGDIILKKDSNEPMDLGQTVVSENIMHTIMKMNQTLTNDFQLEIREAFISDIVILTTSEGWKIYLDPTENSDLQMTQLRSLLEQEISLSARKKIEYIYLQYKDRVYYK